MHTQLLQEICGKLEAALLQELGAGAFKKAFLIQKDNNLFALKIAPVSGAFLARFEREIAALQKCNHPAIARIYSSELVVLGEKEYWVIVEEYLPCGTLIDITSKAPLSLESIRHLGIVLVGAIAHLSERSFVHRDIKPANIIYRTDNEPVLTDFGIVRMLDEHSLTQDFMAQGPGTPMYAAPEQLLNDKCSIDWRTDQYGLALVLAEQLLGHHAFQTDANGHVRDAISTVANRNFLPAKSRIALEEKGFGCLVKALSPWPVQRFRSPEQFLKSF